MSQTSSFNLYRHSNAPPPYSYGSRNEDRTPLLATKPKAYLYRRYATFIFLVVVVVGGITALIAHLDYDAKNTDRPAVRDRQREEWKLETERMKEERQALLAEVEKEHERRLEASERVLQMREAAIKDKEDTMRRDEERRQRSGLLWDNIKPDEACLSFESRRYTAELVNIPTDSDVDGLKWCMETQIEIHGATYEHPRRCERNDEGKIIAEWITHSNEPTCRTYWDQHTKKHCNGNNKRIFEAKLENHQPPWDNWLEMCVSTPSHFNFGHHDRPDICRPTAHDGIFGSWFVFDEECP